LLVNQVLIEVDGKDEVASFAPGAIVTGIVGAVNMGRGPLEIVYSLCMPYWRAGKLPMKRPYQGTDVRRLNLATAIPRTRLRDGRRETISLAPNCQMQSGDVLQWEFETAVPADYTPDMNLYVLGLVIYLDQLRTRRATLFTRRYDFRKGRFLPVKNNPIYEGEE
jgi:hypothetical protein